jgi:hypothetical protein
VLLSIALALVASSASAVTFVPLEGELSVITSSNRRSAAVTVSNNGAVVAQFCLSFPEPLDQAISISGKGRVIYLPQPLEGLPPGVETSGPEPIAQTLTVLQESGAAFAFVGKGIKPIARNATVIEITSVTRQDWLGPNDTRRVPGVEACLSAGG